MVFIYNFFILLYSVLLRLAAFRHHKARSWVDGRTNLFQKLQADLAHNTRPLIWVHSASTGEFEQAKPLIEALRQQFPSYRILASFFSPSGFEANASYAHVHYRCYLPLDTRDNATRFLKIVRPALVVFAKYDFWYHHLMQTAKANVPLVLVSGAFRREQFFFRWYGGFFRSVLRLFTHLFVQDEPSLKLLRSIGVQQCSVSGDTRFDRVVQITEKEAMETPTLQQIKTLIHGRKSVVAGSTWPGDEALIADVLEAFPSLCWIIVPHELDEAHLTGISERFPGAVRLSQLANLQQPEKIGVLVVDAMGLLSRLYQLASITYVGGGFTKDGIHNTLEAAVWGKPVIIGPNYKKYREAKELIATGGAFAVANAAALQQLLTQFTNNTAALEAASRAARKYVLKNAGATEQIMKFLRGFLG